MAAPLPDERMLVVVGGDSSDPGWADRQAVAAQILYTGKLRGFTEASMALLSEEGFSGHAPVAPPSVTSLNDQLITLGSFGGHVAVFIIAEVEGGKIHLSSLAGLDPAGLDAQLDQAQSLTTSPAMTVVLETSDAGSFLAACAPEAAQQRWMVAATRANRVRNERAPITFTSIVMSEIEEGKNLPDAVLMASSKVREYSGRQNQTPQLLPVQAPVMVSCLWNDGPDLRLNPATGDYLMHVDEDLINTFEVTGLSPLVTDVRIFLAPGSKMGPDDLQEVELLPVRGSGYSAVLPNQGIEAMRGARVAVRVGTSPWISGVHVDLHFNGAKQDPVLTLMPQDFVERTPNIEPISKHAINLDEDRSVTFAAVPGHLYDIEVSPVRLDTDISLVITRMLSPGETIVAEINEFGFGGTEFAQLDFPEGGFYKLTVILEAGLSPPAPSVRADAEINMRMPSNGETGVLVTALRSNEDGLLPFFNTAGGNLTRTTLYSGGHSMGTKAFSNQQDAFVSVTADRSYWVAMEYLPYGISLVNPSPADTNPRFLPGNHFVDGQAHVTFSYIYGSLWVRCEVKDAGTSEVVPGAYLNVEHVGAPVHSSELQTSLQGKRWVNLLGHKSYKLIVKANGYSDKQVNIPPTAPNGSGYVLRINMTLAPASGSTPVQPPQHTPNPIVDDEGFGPPTIVEFDPATIPALSTFLTPFLPSRPYGGGFDTLDPWNPPPPRVPIKGANFELTPFVAPSPTLSFP